MSLRPYQVDAVVAVWRDLDNGVRRPAVVLPTGSGKTHVIAELALQWRRRHPERPRVLVLAHRTELIEQAAGKLRAADPKLKVGIVKANRNQPLSPVVVASVQTLRSESRRLQVMDVGLVIVDECHHGTALSYRSALEHYGALGDGKRKAVAVGFTATMTRGDKAQLGDVWETVSYTRTIGEMIRDGYLVRPIGIHVTVDDLDLSKVKKSRGDYAEGDLGKALADSLAPRAVLRAWLEHASDRQTLLFTPTVALAEEMAQIFEDAGFGSAVVHGGLAPEVRASRLDSYRQGQTKVLCNCAVLTEGTDLPSTSCVVIMRPTHNSGLFIQIVGRGLRIDPDRPAKTDCVVLDVVGATQRHTLSCGIDLFGEEVSINERGEEIDEPEVEVEQEPKEEELKLYRDGQLISYEVDLFGSTSCVWLQTRAGYWFLRTAYGYLVILPGAVAGTYDVVRAGENQGDASFVARGFASFKDAMGQAEVCLTTNDMTFARRKRKWRRGSVSPKMRNLARLLGLLVDESMTPGEVSDMITKEMASRRIDRCLEERV